MKYLRLAEATETELEQIEFSFKKRIRGWFFNPLVKKKLWDGYVPFFKNNLIPIGLWNEIFKLGEAFGFPVEIVGLDRIIDQNFDEEDFFKWANDFFSDHPKYKPREYQLDAAAKVLKYRLSSSQIATSAGKTLIAFLVYGYLKYKGMINKMLIIVPNTTLVMQLRDDWEEYSNGKIELKIRQVYGGSKNEKPDDEIIVGTFHSLTKKRIDYFKGVGVVFVDEAHQTKTASIKKIIDMCVDSKFRFGLSGTLQEDQSADFFTITALLGPVVNNISPRFLFREGVATPIKVKIFVLDYKKEDLRKKLYDIRRARQLEGSQILALEKKVAINSEDRTKFIVSLLAKTTKNTLVLFQNIKDRYGKKLYERVKEQTDKICYYVDGGVSQDHREFFKKEMENGNDKILFASFTTFSTGISIKNLHNIIFVESYKSEIIIKQSIGRGMRLLANKDSVNIVDIVDDLSWQGKDNYLLRHGKARLEFYKEYTSEIKVNRINIA
jgi:superfamily II DNA or RNA helicase